MRIIPCRLRIAYGPTERTSVQYVCGGFHPVDPDDPRRDHVPSCRVCRRRGRDSQCDSHSLRRRDHQSPDRDFHERDRYEHAGGRGRGLFPDLACVRSAVRRSYRPGSIPGSGPLGALLRSGLHEFCRPAISGLGGLVSPHRLRHGDPSVHHQSD